MTAGSYMPLWFGTALVGGVLVLAYPAPLWVRGLGSAVAAVIAVSAALYTTLPRGGDY